MSKGLFFFFDPEDPPIPSCAPMVQYCFDDGYCIQKVLLAPSCLIALIQGIVMGIMIKNSKKQYPSKVFYTLCFIGFGMMMTFAGILHCFLHDDPEKGDPGWLVFLRKLFGLCDVTLTSNIALTFAFAGLADLGIWTYQKVWCRILSVMSWLAILVGWIIVIYFNGPKSLFYVLYIKVIAVSGGIWVVSQILLFAFGGEKLTKKAKMCIFLAVLCGGLGLGGLVPQIGSAICKIEGYKLSAWLHPEVLWFYGSNFSMLFMGFFVLITKKGRERAIRAFLPT